MSIIYFLVREYYRINNDNLSKRQFYLIGFFVGIIVMLIEIFVLIWYPSQDKLLQYITFTAIYIIIFSTMLDKRFSLWMSLFAILGIFLRIAIYDDSTSFEIFKGSTVELINIISISVVVFLYSYNSTNFSKNNGKQTIVLFASWLFFFTITLAIIITLFSANTATTLATLIFYLPFYLFSLFLIQFSIVLLIEKIYINSGNLETFSTKDDISYYKISLSQDMIKETIIENKYDFGLIVILSLSKVDKESQEDVLVLIREKLLEIYDDVLFLKATSSSYGFFIPIKNTIRNIEISYKNNFFEKRNREDLLFRLDDFFNETFDEKGFNVTAGITIYGIHSNDIYELILKAEQLLNSSISYKTKTILYDYKYIKKQLEKNLRVANLSFFLQNLNITFISAVSHNDIYYPIISFKINSAKKSLKSILELLSVEDQIIILRYVSLHILLKAKKENNKKIVIYYPIDLLAQKEFSIDNVIDKINMIIDFNKLIIQFDSNKLIDNKETRNNLKMLRKKGIKFLILDVKNANENNVKIINPSYYMFEVKTMVLRTFFEPKTINTLPFKINAKEIY